MNTDQVTEFMHDTVRVNKDHNLIRDNFCGTFSLDYVQELDKCIQEIDLTKTDEKQLPFIIFNTDPSNKPGTHWIGLYNIDNGFMLFDSFGRSNARLLEGNNTPFEKVSETYSKSSPYVDLITLRFDVNKHLHNLKHNIDVKHSILYLGNLITKYGIDNQIEYVPILASADQLQPSDAFTCGQFCCYFTFYLFHNQTATSTSETCDEKTVRTVLNEYFQDGTVEGRNNNNYIVQEFMTYMQPDLKTDAYTNILA